MEIKKLINMAIDNINNAYTPYSNFKVTSVLVTKAGKTYTGVNIENVAHTPTVCAERTAFAKAVSEGEREFERIIILGGKDGIVTELTSPCGVCRQVMMEFCDPETFEIVLAINEDEYEVFKLKELLPLGFGPSNLK